MKTKHLIISLIAVSSLLFVSCGQSDDDIQMEKDLVGYWKPYNSAGDPENYIPNYLFEDENNGTSFLGGNQDDFKWEIINEQLKIYYDEAPVYNIGYNKYNSRSLLQIQSIDQSKFRATMYYSDGYQVDITFKRSEFTPQ